MYTNVYTNNLIQIHYQLNPWLNKLKIEKEAEEILQSFSDALKNIPELEETHYMVDNVNLSREDCAEDKDSAKIMRNAHVDEEGNLIAEKGKWVKWDLISF